MSKTVYISIGNSDDKLPQAEWARFHRDVDFAIRWGEPNIWGAWVSETTAQWQNACWCVDLEPRHIERLRRVLPLIAREYQQRTIAWAVATTEFIAAAPKVDDGARSAAVDGCICSHTIHAHADCPIHGEKPSHA